jgi:hypothetical protein
MPSKPDVTLAKDHADEHRPAAPVGLPHEAASGEVVTFSEKWSPRQTIFFVVGVCGLFWILLAWFIFA